MSGKIIIGTPPLSHKNLWEKLANIQKSKIENPIEKACDPRWESLDFLKRKSVEVK